MSTAKPKLRDVYQLTVKLLPVTQCSPPDGKRCWLTSPTTRLTAAEAKRHALEHPGHEVLRETTERSRYVLEPDHE